MLGSISFLKVAFLGFGKQGNLPILLRAFNKEKTMNVNAALEPFDANVPLKTVVLTLSQQLLLIKETTIPSKWEGENACTVYNLLMNNYTERDIALKKNSSG